MTRPPVDRKAFPRPAESQKITLMYQGRAEHRGVEAFEVNGMLVIPAEDGVVYVTREQARDFFGLVEPAPDRIRRALEMIECGRVGAGRDMLSSLALELEGASIPEAA